jgi:hypothetical protein
MAMYTEADLDRQLQEAITSGRGCEGGGVIIGRYATTTQETARKIMGQNFFGIEEAVRYFGVTPTENERLSVIDWNEFDLRRVKDTHILVAVFPLSFLEIRDRVPHELFCCHEEAWHNEQAFATEKGEPSWELVRKTPVQGSASKAWAKQQALLSEDEEVPTARIMTYTIIGHSFATGEHLFENSYVRCSDVADGCRIHVGLFNEKDGLNVGGSSDGSRDRRIGMASARRKPGSTALS